MQELIIDKDFFDLIPPLTTEEFSQLEENILRDGIQDPLKVWNNTLIDGHNRYKIAQQHNLPFEVTEMNFESRNDAVIWIIKNQFGRRNLSAYDRSILALKLKPIIAAKAKENQIRKPVESVLEKSPKQKTIDTRQEIAKAAGVSDNTIAKVEKIEQKATPEVKAALKSGEMSVNQAFNEIKKVEKQEKIEQAKADIAAQFHEDNTLKARLTIGDGINFKPAEPYNLLLTDPPYSTDIADIDTFAQSWLPNALNFVRDDGFAYVFIGAYPAELKAYLNIAPPKHLTLTQILVWTYKNTLGNNPKDRYKLNYQACLFYRGVNAPNLNCPITNEQWAVQEINAPDGRIGDRYHAWQKPFEIAERFIRHSTKAGDTVFDPFACTGTFLLAAVKLGRNAYGFEINPDNAKIAFERGCANGG